MYADSGIMWEIYSSQYEEHKLDLYVRGMLFNILVLEETNRSCYIYYQSQIRAIDLSKNPVQHSRTKHIEIRHHFLRDNVQKGHISIEKVPSVDNIADILTKPLKRESFNYLRLGLGMMEHIP
ncbi:hypothetical protein Tco_0323468 [Tanacetum coccineum]